MIEILDARAARWPRALRWLYLFMRWSLVCIGAAMLTFHFTKEWGWYAGLWLLIAPLLHGFLQGAQEERQD